jgi:hypothetical protein
VIEQKQENWALQQQLTSFFKIHRQNTYPLKREKKLLEYQTFQNLNDSSKKLEQKYLAIVSWSIISLVSLTKNSRSLSPPTIFSPLLSKIISLPFFYPIRLFIFFYLVDLFKKVFFFHFFVAFIVNSFVCLLCLSSSQTIPKLIHDMKSSCFVVAEKKRKKWSPFFFYCFSQFCIYCWWIYLQIWVGFGGIRTSWSWKIVWEQKEKVL